MRWIFGIVGLVLGGLSGGVVGAFFGVLVGVGLASLILYMDKRASSQWAHPPEPDAARPTTTAAATTLHERVAQLEHEVSLLRRQMAEIRGGTSAAPLPDAVAATPPHVAPAPALAETLPRIEAVAAPQAPVPSPPSAPEPEPQPEPVVQPVMPQMAPHEPDWVERAVGAARDWLLGGNSVVRVGILILFFGVAFLLKYAADNSLLPVEFRLAGVAVGAIVLLGIGWRLRDRRPGYALVLQGGGVGVLYLTVFAATRMVPLLSPGMAFPLLVLICALAAGLAVRQNAPALAFTGSAGGFLAPILISTGQGSHVALFSYYALLNAGIFAIAWFRAWRALNLLGFVFTFGIATAWGVLRYQPSLLSSTEPFLILFFLMYVGIALLYALRRRVSLNHYVDGTLVFGTPLVAMGLQAGLVHHIPFAMAWSAAALAAFYLGMAAWLAPRRANLGLLYEAMFALAVIFITLAIPLAFDGRTTSAVWALEGAAVVWLGVQQQRRLALAVGLLLQVAAGVALTGSTWFDWDPATGWPVLNRRYIGGLLMALAGVFSGWQLHGRAPARAWLKAAPALGIAASVWGLLWWLGSGSNEIDRWAWRIANQTIDRPDIPLYAGFAVLTAWAAHALRRRLDWTLAEWPALALSPALAVVALAAIEHWRPSPLAGWGGLVWIASVVLAFVLQRRQERDVKDVILAPLHTVLFWLICGMLATEGYWRLDAYVPEGTWSFAAWAYAYGALLALLAGAGWRIRWPIARFERAYLLWGAAPLAALLWLWSLASAASDGDAAPLFYLPILNPLDVAQVLVFLAITLWMRRVALQKLVPEPLVIGYAVGATLFIWANAVLLRTLHHWAHVPYTPEGLGGSMLVQASLSMFWTVLALVVMVLATRRASRALWFTGGALLGVTVVKLFLFDLSRVTGVERIVSFIAIGVLLLLIGYLSPLPPKAKATGETGEVL
ncbi:DUF2339 domain-containing protein [Ralstonia mannitolilytica]|uniref:DUF2339 domain-containing protein n=1 Tax=Ralstonia mannitolilytica TaxID=105219 RepID=A0AAD2EM08_9RALS|nr:DUF2339 domain-containing protein [Ralstonia mannitolilytica]MBY4717423.1 DUF2339 domain-containing protein [Ralstonia mannitolilytica]CAJ0694711.1 hypothetical protein R77591_04299 [Ralstonia mannitolilytica]CAJ0874283.1 hypothetical protein R77569_02601 [Ralstonia mannitolilytica]